MVPSMNPENSHEPDPDHTTEAGPDPAHRRDPQPDLQPDPTTPQRHPVPERTPEDMADMRERKAKKKEFVERRLGELAERAAKRANDRESGFAPDDLAGLATMSVDVSAVIAEAAALESRWLHKVALVDLLCAAGESQTDAVERVQKMLRLLDEDPGTAKTTVIGWLLDGRSRARRLAVWADVHHDAAPPSSTWPYGPDELVRPTHGGASRPPALVTNTESPRSRVTERPMTFKDATTFVCSEEPATMARIWLDPAAAAVLAPGRADPYYAQFAGGDAAPLLSFEMRNDLYRRGVLSQPPARRKTKSARRRKRSLVQNLLVDLDLFIRVHGALFCFGTLSEDQLRLIVGPTVTRKRLRTQLDASHDYGLVKHTDDRRDLKGVSRLYALSSKATWTRLCAHHLSTATMLAVTGGAEWRGRGPVGRRHDVLLAELLLRWAAAGTVAAILGEPFSTRRLLTPHPDHHATKPWLKGRADGVVVREDGLRIAIELTATINEKKFAAKVVQWLDYFAAIDPEDGGCTVVFVLAPHPKGSDPRKVRDRARRVIDTVLADIPATVRARIAHRLGLVAWSDWFPDHHTARADAFAAMTVTTPAGTPGADRRTWTTRSFLDASDRPFTPHEPYLATAVIDHALFLGQTPRFLELNRRKELTKAEVTLPPPWWAACEWSRLPMAPPVKPVRHSTTTGHTTRALNPDARTERQVLPASMKFDL